MRVCEQYIEATDLELEMKKENAVRYHEAWQLLCSSSGVLIPGGFGVRGMEGKILAAEWARKTKKPFLGNDRHLLNLCRVPECSEVGIAEFKLVNRSCELVNSQFELGPDRSSPTWVP